MKMLLTAALFVSAVFAASSPVREVQSECPKIPGQPVCEFRNGQLFRFSSLADRVIRVYAPDGRFAFNIPIFLPGADSSWAEDVGVDSDGTFVVAARGTKRFGLVMLDSNGVQTSFIDTQDFRPGRVAIAPDHSIWVLGSRERSKKNPDYMILRKYSRQGELAGSYLPRSSFAPGLEPGSAGVSESVMAAENRIVVVAVSGQVSNLRELIELDGNGNVLGRMRSDHDNIMRFALTADGHVYGCCAVRAAHPESTLSLTLFDVTAGTSSSVDAPQPRSWLMGADGENLVYEVAGEEGWVKAAWIRQPAAGR
jgi:hypothetical protein